MTDPNVLLQQVLEGHGLAVLPGNGWLTADGRNAAICATTYRDPAWHASLLQLDIRVLTADRRQLIESFTGIGDDEPSALRSAIGAFIQASLHVLLTTFWRVDPGEQVHLEAWSTAPGERTAALGPMVQRGGPVDMPDALIPTIREVAQSRCDGPLHWFRVFHTRGDTSPTTTEVLLDNEPWPELQAAVHALPWPKVDGYHSARVFGTLFDPDTM